MRLLYRIKIIVITFFIISCSNGDHSSLQGYIEGEFIYISSPISGKLFHLNVIRGQEVQKNQLLFKLDPQPEQDLKVVVEETIHQLQSELTFDQSQLARQQHLYPQKATEKASLDRAQRDFESKGYQIEGAEAQLKQAEWSLSQKTLFAPMNSQVVDIYFRVGENVPANQPVLSLLAPAYIHVLFYIPESILNQIHIGQTISFTCDSCKEKTRATIRYISPEAEYTPPILYSKDTRYKLVYLVRADMAENLAKQFHPGQPVDIFLHE